MPDKEKKVFSQEVNRDDLKAVAGGGSDSRCGEIQEKNCIVSDKRDIYGGRSFPNCAATVEDGSYCTDNDACRFSAVRYVESIKDDCTFVDCQKAWH